MTRATRYSPLLLITLTAAVSPASGQDAPPLWQPVDQSVSDLDLRASSTRYIEQGIGVFGQSGGLYQRAGDGYQPFGPGQTLNQQYQLRQPGYTAWLDRPDYLVIDPLGELRLNVAPGEDRRFIDLIPPNTVFDLVPPSQKGFLPIHESYDADRDPNQLDTRIDGFIGGTVTGTPIIQPLLQPPRAHRLPQHLIEQRQSRARDEQTQADSAPRDTDEPADSSANDEAVDP